MFPGILCFSASVLF